MASFTVPLGATINSDGTAIMQVVATVFIAIHLNRNDDIRRAIASRQRR